LLVISKYKVDCRLGASDASANEDYSRVLKKNKERNTKKDIEAL